MKFRAGMPCYLVGLPTPLASANGRVVELAAIVDRDDDGLDVWAFTSGPRVAWGELRVEVTKASVEHLRPLLPPAPPVLAEVPKAVGA